MAVGDTVSDWQSKTAGSTLDVQPGSGVEWLIHTIVSEQGKEIEVYITADGSTFTLTDTAVGGTTHALTFRLTNSKWMRLKNVAPDTRFIGYQGVVTK